MTADKADYLNPNVVRWPDLREHPIGAAAILDSVRIIVNLNGPRVDQWSTDARTQAEAGTWLASVIARAQLAVHEPLTLTVSVHPRYYT